jgi:DDE superfamily endonuclease
MSPLSDPIIALLRPFAGVFTAQVWPHALVLLLGAILSPGKRTVTVALRLLGLANDKHFINYHRVLSRAKWSSLTLSRILLGLLVTILLAADAPLILIVDDTLERRRGKKIKALGLFRDAARSSTKHTVTSFGLRWVCMTLLVKVPWARRPWALPFLTVLAAGRPKGTEPLRRHKTCVDWAGQMLRQVRHWHAARQVVLLTDGGYASLKLAWQCQCGTRPAILVTRLVLNAQLYDPPPLQPKRRGKPPQKGPRQPKLSVRVSDPTTAWNCHTLAWYGGPQRQVWLASGTALWHRDNYRPLAIRWVLVRLDPQTPHAQAFLCTDVSASPVQILQWMMLRWNIEVTFEEVRAHLGVESQRQWSALAIVRTTPALLGLFSLVVLMAHAGSAGHALPLRQSAWYTKEDATFADCLAYVRRHLWTQLYCATSALHEAVALKQVHTPAQLLELLCYAE